HRSARAAEAAAELIGAATAGLIDTRGDREAGQAGRDRQRQDGSQQEPGNGRQGSQGQGGNGGSDNGQSADGPSGQGRQGQGPNRQNQRGEDGFEDDERGGRRRRNRYRDRDRGKRRGRGMDSYEDVEISEDDVLIPVAGILDILDNYA